MKVIIAKFVMDFYALLCRAFTRVNPYVMVFKSFPDYSDNSRALSEYLVNKSYTNTFKIYWVVENPKQCKKKFPNAGVVFLGNSLCSKLVNMPILISAGWFFSTHGFPCKYKYVRKNQHFIKVWHGCGFKDVDSRKKARKRKEDTDDFEKILLVSDFFKHYMAPKWFWPQDKVVAKGFPRFDWLLQKTEVAKEFCSSIKSCQSDKVVVWMPTFRNHINGVYNDNDDIKQFPIVNSCSDWRAFDKCCKENGVVVLVKLHPMQKSYDIPWSELSNIHQLTNEMLDVANTTLYSFLSVTDGLISDYSSVTVDYMIVDKPIAFTLDDFHLYDKGRGFIIDNPLDYMPGHHLYSMEDMRNFIVDVSLGRDIYKEKRAALYDTLLYRSDNYCKEIINELGISREICQK